MQKFIINILLMLAAIIVTPFYIILGALVGVGHLFIEIFRGMIYPIQEVIKTWHVDSADNISIE